MGLHLFILVSSVLLFKNEINQIFKQPLAILSDCQTVQASGRAMTMQTLNIWTVITVFMSLMYLSGMLVLGVVPAKVLYHAACYHLLTTFMDYSFMVGMRDCSEFDTLRWRVDAFLRCSLYIWAVQFIIRNAIGQISTF